ncbi:drug/metabolite transporter (DMT)-like permease [Primorskyibacter sedentarius]|uniref:Drug/metabolite transporter (DMT)-like permease n=2 Tax=Primorskyibacter sedentarius TaxID=745311 RepID=A0A4R3JBE7_9RHOB|nr:drug/metabolite transporter (DMT)-like permease [Primorskyibacter sedentarius]
MSRTPFPRKAFPMTHAPDITPKSWLMVLTLGVVWGATFMFMEIALRGMTPFWLAAGRISFAAVLTLTVWLAGSRKLFLTEKRDWGALCLVGILSTALPFLLLSWGMQYVTSGFAGVSMATVALMVLPLAHFLVPGERMSLRRFIGFLIGFAGVAVLIGPEAFAPSGAAMEPLGRLACIGVAACYAVSSIAMRRLPPVDPIGLAAVPMLIGALFVIPLAWLREGPPPMPDTQTLIVIAMLGLVPTAGANLLRVLVIRSAGPVFMSLTNYIVPLCSVFLGALVLGEPLHSSLLVALILILAGVALSQYGALRRLFGRDQ